MDSDSIVCEVCGDVVKMSLLDKHIRLGHRLKPEYNCNLCQKQFTSRFNLRYHMAHHFNERNFLCNECPKTYNTASDLAQHMRIHEKAHEPYTCEICGKIFRIQSKLRTHMKSHKSSLEPKRPQECSICNKSFVSLLSHHATVHLKIRKYKCEELACGKSFGKKSGLTRHKSVIHDKLKPFKCIFKRCERAFGEKAQLSKHLKIHAEKYCKLCPQKFERWKSLNDHMKQAHHGDKQYSCDFCTRERVFVNLKAFKNHLAMHTDHFPLQEDVEDYCDIEFASACLSAADQSEDEKETPIDVKPEEVFENDAAVFQDEIDLPPEPQQDFLLEIKEEVLSDDEVKAVSTDTLVMTIKAEPEEFAATAFVPPVKIPQCKIKSEPELIIFDDDRPNLNLLMEQYAKLPEMVSTESDIKMLKCNQCQRIFHNQMMFDRHNQLFHEKSINHQCTKCTDTFDLKFDLERHFKIAHTGVKTRTCDICNKSFKKKKNLQMHVRAVHCAKNFECPDCGKKFPFKCSRDRHVKVVHLNQRDYQCNVCQKSFGTKSDMRNHVAFFHNSNPDDKGKHYCSMCDKSFVSSRTLLRHHRGVHENIKQKRPRFYRCKYCKESLPNKYQKDKHVAQVHQDGLKPLRTCKTCNLDFTLYDDFMNHINSHEESFICLICGLDNEDQKSMEAHSETHRHIDLELRRYVCDLCGHKLFNKIQLTVHMRKHMEETNFYVCDVCGQSYKFIAPFLYHKKLHEGKKDFICAHCGKEFMRRPDLIVHVRRHTQEKPFKCKVCEKRFAAKQILYIHLQTHPETRKVYECKKCHLKFEDKNKSIFHDEKVHPDRRPFRCQHCKQSFTNQHLLKIHLKHKHKQGENIKEEFVVTKAEPVQTEFMYKSLDQ